MRGGAAARWWVVPAGTAVLLGCAIESSGLAGLDGSVRPDGRPDDASSDRWAPDGGPPDAPLEDAGRTPVLEGTDYDVVVHGSQLIIDGYELEEVDTVEIGGVAHAPAVVEGDRLVVSQVSDMARTGLAQVIAITPTARSNSLTVTVVHLVISELDQQTSAGSDRRQLVEIAADVSALPIDGYTLVLYGSDGLSYRATPVMATTPASGLVLIGGPELVPVPAITLPADAIRDGPGAAVIHQGSPSDYLPGTMITASRAIDGLVFHRSGGPEGGVLLDALFGSGPGRVQVNENQDASEIGDSIQRCSRERLDGRAFQVATATPGASNTCSTSGD